MAHPGNIRKSPKDRVKTNRLDSIKLLKDLTSGDLPGIRVPDEAYRQLRHITSTRQHYANDLRRVKQRIESFLLFESILLPELTGTRWTQKHIGLLKNIKLDQVRQFKMNSFLSDLEYSRQRLLLVHKELRMFLRQNTVVDSHIRLLKSLPGFGVVVSAYFLARIGNPENLKNAREIGAFIGIVPTEHSTGDTTRRGHITHMGDPVLRGLLVEAGWVAIRRDRELKQFYERIRSKNPGSKGTKIAIVAVARKLTHRAHRVLKDQRPYEFR
jgi:transposase